MIEHGARAPGWGDHERALDHKSALTGVPVPVLRQRAIIGERRARTVVGETRDTPRPQATPLPPLALLRRARQAAGGWS